MPTYEYRCTQCDHRFDVFQRIDDATLTVCDRCGGELRKVFHPAGIVFKGSGFYATDSRSKGAKKEASETKTDTKKDGKDAKDGKKDAPAKKATSTESS